MDEKLFGDKYKKYEEEKGITAKELGMSELEWVQMVEQVDAMPKTEGFKEKFMRKTKDNPFVPVGILATCTALTLGLVSMKKGNSKNSQFWMRARVLAQGFTIGAIVIGLGITAIKPRINAEVTSE